MKKTKLIVSICVASTLGVGILSGVYKIQENNKVENIQVNSEESLDKDTKKSVEKGTDKSNEESVKEETTSVNDVENSNKTNEYTTTESVENVETGNSESNEENLVESQETEENIAYKENYVQVPEEETPSKVEQPGKIEIPEKVEIVDKVEVPDNSWEPSQDQSDSYISEIEQAIFTRVNAERTSRGLQPLNYNNTMQNYARIKSKDMGDRGYFAHENPEGELITAQMKRDGVTYSAWGENIAYIQGNQSNASLAEQFMNNWMNSQGHRENILSSNFKSIGIGVYKIGNTYYATQEFYR